jgi:hypothetical protein
MTENTFWQSLKRALGPRVYSLKLNVRFIAGVPDVWLSGSERDLWLELKYLQTLPPVVDPTKLLTVLQQEWLKGRWAEGRHVGVLIGSSSGHLLFPGLSWEQPISREQFLQRAEKTKRIADDLVAVLGNRLQEGLNQV